jgi:dTMP kinase
MFITFEGIDYSGKSTQAKLLHEYFTKNRVKSILVREPGGTKISEKIREILLNREHLEMLPLTEYFLFSASRAQLVNEVIIPNLNRGVVVICDRYYDSSSAYQGFGGRVDVKKIFDVNDFATSALKPDLTFLIDISPKKAFERAAEKHTLDRMESKKLSFYNRVKNGFLEIARKNKKRFVVIDGTKPVEEIHGTIINVVIRKLSFPRRRESD